MDKWEYLSLRFHIDSNSKKWVRTDNKTTAERLDQMLNPLGEQGWELVAFESSYQERADWVGGPNQHIVTGWEISAYRAVFKRRRV